MFQPGGRTAGWRERDVAALSGAAIRPAPHRLRHVVHVDVRVPGWGPPPPFSASAGRSTISRTRSSVSCSWRGSGKAVGAEQHLRSIWPKRFRRRRRRRNRRAGRPRRLPCDQGRRGPHAGFRDVRGLKARRGRPPAAPAPAAPARAAIRRYKRSANETRLWKPLSSHSRRRRPRVAAAHFSGLGEIEPRLRGPAPPPASCRRPPARSSPGATRCAAEVPDVDQILRVVDCPAVESG